MSLFERIDELRQRPEAERRRLVIWFSVLGTLIIFILCLLNWRFLWQNNQVEAEKPVTTNSIEAPESSFWKVWDGVGATWNDGLVKIKTGWQTIQTTIRQ